MKVFGLLPYVDESEITRATRQARLHQDGNAAMTSWAMSGSDRPKRQFARQHDRGRIGDPWTQQLKLMIAHRWLRRADHGADAQRPSTN
ncbi:MAG: hypothetical protein U5M50_16075 [Sphingobium sp.]|nr:hypothetical protein [Sphingobium sp.]